MFMMTRLKKTYLDRELINISIPLLEYLRSSSFADLSDSALYYSKNVFYLF
jgi:hypothetical protein